MSSEKYIKVDDINIETTDNDFDKNELLENEGFDVYQLQPIKKSNNCLFLKVGKCIELPLIMINQFDFDYNTTCFIISPLYTNDDLENNIFQQKEILIKNKSTMKDIANLKLNFTINNNNIKELISTKENNKIIEGYYTICFCYKNKTILLEKIDKFNSDIIMFEKMLFHLNTFKIKNIIENLIKNNL
jgi:hypothetical protein